MIVFSAERIKDAELKLQQLQTNNKLSNEEFNRK
jgi:hypothetical protein